ncbi:hypothetical protein F2P81_008401 [Scophthalmus maximus]|uniref:Uncharacterized protein n=1 Tax=Scophthalmus maximus TaxID=52904 RepID=A0A6A4SY56_SCOMX|nr:hypothetical protein F2P81_008401 [Scophthalmus maximus]
MYLEAVWPPPTHRQLRLLTVYSTTQTPSHQSCQDKSFECRPQEKTREPDRTHSSAPLVRSFAVHEPSQLRAAAVLSPSGPRHRLESGLRCGPEYTNATGQKDPRTTQPSNPCPNVQFDRIAPGSTMW